MNMISGLYGGYSFLPYWLVSIVLVWSLVWKGLALWKSAKKNHTIWFIVFLVVQTMGILEILYLFLFSEIKMGSSPSRKSSSKSSSNKKRSKKR